MFIDLLDSPIGLITIIADDNNLISIKISDSNIFKNPNNITNETKKQLNLYFKKKIKKFDLPINYTSKSLFNKKVWIELQKIEYGKTKSYKDIATKLGNPKSARAVGNANNKNNILIIIPCHRVINNNGTIGGYALGINIKKFLLNLEQNI